MLRGVYNVGRVMRVHIKPFQKLKQGVAGSSQLYLGQNNPQKIVSTELIIEQ